MFVVLKGRCVEATRRPPTVSMGCSPALAAEQDRRVEAVGCERECRMSPLVNGAAATALLGAHLPMISPMRSGSPRDRRLQVRLSSNALTDRLCGPRTSLRMRRLDEGPLSVPISVPYISLVRDWRSGSQRERRHGVWEIRMPVAVCPIPRRAIQHSFTCPGDRDTAEAPMS